MNSRVLPEYQVSGISCPIETYSIEYTLKISKYFLTLSLNDFCKCMGHQFLEVSKVGRVKIKLMK